MIDMIIEQAIELEQNWQLDQFPERSLNILRELDRNISFEEFEESIGIWLLSHKKLPPQVNLYNSFGEPPVTIFNNGKFAVDIYFWRKNNTLIHSHAFRGAFKVLFGQSLHEQFEVTTLEPVDDDLILSKLSDSKKEILQAGSVQIINPGMELVHRIVHLDNPTVTLCIRTVNDIKIDQWHHLPTGMSYKKHNLSEETIKRILFFEFKYNSNSSRGLDFLNKILSEMSTSAQLDLYESLFTNELGLDYDIASLVVDEIHKLFSSEKWHTYYSDHFANISQGLDEYQLNDASLRLLAHSINNNFPVADTITLLNKLTDKNYEELIEQLLTSPVFNEDHYDEQLVKVKNYFK